LAKVQIIKKDGESDVKDGGTEDGVKRRRYPSKDGGMSSLSLMASNLTDPFYSRAILARTRFSI
jgi:hypothetical protein